MIAAVVGGAITVAVRHLSRWPQMSLLAFLLVAA
jgi:hypothetical protein